MKNELFRNNQIRCVFLRNLEGGLGPLHMILLKVKSKVIEQNRKMGWESNDRILKGKKRNIENEKKIIEAIESIRQTEDRVF